MADTYVELISELTINWTQYSASARRVFRLEPTATPAEGGIAETDLPTWGSVYNPDWSGLNPNMVPDQDVQNRLVVVGITAEWPDDENYELTYQYEAPNNGAATSNIIIPSGGTIIGTKSFSMSRDFVTIESQAQDGNTGWLWLNSGDEVKNHPIEIPFITASFEITEYFSNLADAVASGNGDIGKLGITTSDLKEWLFIGLDVNEATQADGSPAFTARRKYEYKHNIPGRDTLPQESSWNIRWNRQAKDWDIAVDENFKRPYRGASSKLPDADFLPIPHDPGSNVGSSSST